MPASCASPERRGWRALPGSGSLAPPSSHESIFAMHRSCPNCGKPTIPVWKLVLFRVRCTACGADVGTKPAWRLPLYSVELVLWALAASWLSRDYGRAGLVASLVAWLVVDVIADCYIPLVARRR